MENGGRGSYSWNVVDVGLLHHRAHCFGHISRLEFVERVFIPDSFEIEVWAVHEFLEEGQVAGVGECFVGIVVAVG